MCKLWSVYIWLSASLDCYEGLQFPRFCKQNTEVLLHRSIGKNSFLVGLVFRKEIVQLNLSFINVCMRTAGLVLARSLHTNEKVKGQR